MKSLNQIKELIDSKKLIAGALVMTSALSTATSQADESKNHLKQIEAAAIKSIVEQVGLLADTHQFEILETLYADEIHVDYSSLTGTKAELKSPKALMCEWASVLPGFDLTRHAISDIHIKFDKPNIQKATATAKVIADHYLSDNKMGDLSWQVRGDYLYQLTKTVNGWKITHHTFNLRSEQGTRDVFGPAIERAKEHPPTYILRQKTEQAVRHFLESLETKDMALFATLWADDAVQDMPYSPEGFPDRVNGKENIITHYSGWPENSGKADFTSALVFYPMQNPEMVFAEFKGDVDIIPTGRKYLQHYGGLFHVENGKIKLFREYFNPGPFVYAFGMDQ